jgi:hypothetical protein
MAEEVLTIQPVEADFGPYWGKRTIGGLKDFDALVSQEIEGWKWLTENNNQSPHPTQFRQSIQGCLSKFSKAREAIRQLLDSPQSKDSVRANEVFRNQVNQCAALFSRAATRFLPSDSEPVQFLKRFYVAKPEVASAAGLYISSTQPSLIDGTYAAGVAEAILFDRSVPSQEDWLAGISSIKSQMHANVFGAVKGLRDFTVQVTKESEAIRESNRVVRESAGLSIDQATGAISSATEQLKKDVDAIREFYRRETQLQASTTYWAERVAECRTVWVGALVAMIVLGGVASGLSWYRYDKFLDDVLSVKDGLQLAAFVLSIGLLLWALGLSAKIFLRNLNGWTEAKERVTMVKTYLSLIAENKGPPESDRTLLLLSLFRPSAAISEDEKGNYSQLALEAFRQAMRSASPSK